MKIVNFGDSITDMNRNREADGTVYGYGSGYSFLVACQLISENPEKYQVVNRGVSGNRIVDLYARVKSDVWNLQPDVLSILIGVNDVWHEVSGKNGVELDRFDRIYRTLIKETQERLPNCKIMIIEPYVLKGSATQAKYDEFLEIKNYAKAVRKIAEDFNLPFVSLQEKLDAATAKHGVEPYSYDGVHPNVAGVKLIADEWLKTFREKIDV